MKKPLIILSVTCLLTGCGEQPGEPATPVFMTQKSSADMKYAGKWHHNSTIFDSEDLLLNTDHTFTYSDESCTSRHYSKGHWRQEGNGVILLSDSAYRRKDDTVIVTGKHGDTVYTITPVHPFEDSIYFDNVHVAITGDTLMDHDVFISKRLVRQ